MKKWLDENIKTLPMEIRLLVFAAMGGILFSILTGFGNIILKLGNTMVLVAFGTGLVSMLVLYFALVKKSYRVPAYLGILSLVLVMYPIMWVNSGGSVGTMTFFMLFNAILCSLLVSYLNYRLILVLQLLVLYGLLLLEKLKPGIIVGYPNDMTRFIDIGFSFTIVFLLTFALLVKIMKVYNRNILELEQVKEELTQINNQLLIVSETDELTKISNRRCIMTILNSTLAEKSQTLTSVIMIDIDHFKVVNDTYGHTTGDEVLKKVSRTLKEHIRKGDYLGRIGGEEFLIVLPETSLDEAYSKANQLRELIEKLEWEYEDMSVTISGGVFCEEKEKSMDDLLEQVDQQLYYAKNKGRNRICKPC